MQPWAVEERVSRNLTERGYDDPTAHCFPPACLDRCIFPKGLEIIQTPDYIVFLHERTSWRIVPLDGRPHLPDTMRLWQGDSVGHWEGDTLVIDTTNLNGKTWLDEGGEIVSYAEHVVERFTPVDPDTLNYEATVTDPVVYTRPWTIAFPMKREKFELQRGGVSRGRSRSPAPEGPQRRGSREETLGLTAFWGDLASFIVWTNPDRDPDRLRGVR